MELLRQKNVATYIMFPLVDDSGDPVTSATSLDSEIDAFSDGAAPDGFVNCSNEAIEIGSTGIYYLSLIQAEMNVDYIYIQIKSGNANTQHILITTMIGDPSLRATNTLGREFGVAADGDVSGNIDGVVSAVSGNLGGNVSGSVGSVTGSVASVSGSVGSVTGAVGSVSGDLGGDVKGSVDGTVASVTGNVAGSVASVTGAVGSVSGNIGGNVSGSVGSVTGAVGSVTGNVGGTVASVIGSVGSVSGNVGGNVSGSTASVTGSVGSVAGNVSGNVVGSVGSLIGHTVQTGDSYSRIGAAGLGLTAISEAIVPKKNSTYSFPFILFDSTSKDPITGEDSSIAIEVSKNGGAFAAISGSHDEVPGDGGYTCDAAAADMNFDFGMFKITSDNADDMFVPIPKTAS